MDAILPSGAPLAQDNGTGRCAPLEALTRSRRRLKVAFALTALDGDVKLLRLIDQTSLEAEAPAAAPANGAAMPSAEARGRYLADGSTSSPR